MNFNIDALLAGLEAFAIQFVPLLLQSMAVASGLILILLALRRLYRLAEASGSGGDQRVNWGVIAGQLLLGGMLLRLGATVEDVSQLLFAKDLKDVRSLLGYAPVQAQSGFMRKVLEVCLLWVWLLGWVGAFRGLLLWNKGVAGGDAGGANGDLFWRGLWHLLGGAAAVNLAGMVESFFGN